VTPYVVSLDAAEACDVAVAGGKGARLAELIGAGVQVPPGFVVRAEAWRDYLASGDREERLGRVLTGLGPSPPAATLDAAAHELRDIVGRQPPPDAVRDDVATAYAALGGRLGEDDPAVAVRSSATLEDAEGASFAGQFETFLWVRGADAVLRALVLCWAGLFSPTGIAYGARRGAPALANGMAVVVQAMVRPRASGVMFTLDPGSGDPSIVAIEASWGLGSAVVGGEVTPDSYVVSKPTLAIQERRVRAKAVRHVVLPEGGTCSEPVPDELRSKPCLSDPEVLELARVGRRLESLFGAPQDIEWSVDERLELPDSIAVLQCRPETVWSTRRRTPVRDPAAGALGWITDTLTKGA
jgi:pyruvate,water dikinase